MLIFSIFIYILIGSGFSSRFFKKAEYGWWVLVTFLWPMIIGGYIADVIDGEA